MLYVEEEKKNCSGAVTTKFSRLIPLVTPRVSEVQVQTLRRVLF